MDSGRTQLAKLLAKPALTRQMKGVGFALWLYVPPTWSSFTALSRTVSAVRPKHDSFQYKDS